jgi:replicative DNA helicase
VHSTLISIKAIDRAVKQYGQFVEEKRLWLVDGRLYVEDLAAMLESLASEMEIGAVFIDYIQKVPSQNRGTVGQRYLEIKHVSSLLLEQAISKNVPILLGAQLNRTSNTSSRIKLDALRESGDIEQDANLVIGLYNESVAEMEDTPQPDTLVDTDIELSVLKNKAGVSGTKLVLNFHKPTLRITDDGSSGLY